MKDGRVSSVPVLQLSQLNILINALRPRQNGCYFPDNNFTCIFLNENVWILLNISLHFVPKVRINNISALVQIMAWRQPGDKSLSELMVVSLLMHICVIQPHWVNKTHTYKSLLYVEWCNTIFWSLDFKNYAKLSGTILQLAFTVYRWGPPERTLI